MTDSPLALVGESNSDRAEIWQSLLSQIGFEVRVCFDKETFLKIALTSFEPYLLIVEQAFIGSDINNLNFIFKHDKSSLPVIAVYCDSREEEERQSAINEPDFRFTLPVNEKPVVNKLVGMVCAATGEKIDRAMPADREEAVRYILRKFGVPENVKAFEYLVTMINCCIDNPDLSVKVTSLLYPRVAVIHGTTPASVEKLARSALDFLWENGNRELVLSYLGYEAKNKNERPSVGEFAVLVADRLSARFK